MFLSLAICLAFAEDDEVANLAKAIDNFKAIIETTRQELLKSEAAIAEAAAQVLALREKIDRVSSKPSTQKPESTKKVDKAIEEAIRTEAASMTKDPAPVPLALVSVQTPEFKKDVAITDKVMYSTFKNWQCQGIPREGHSDVWTFKGRNGEFLFRADKVSKAVKIVVPSLSFRHCNMRKFKFQFFLQDLLVYETEEFTIGARMPRAAVYQLSETVWFREVKLIASSNADDICFPEFQLLDDSVARPNSEL